MSETLEKRPRARERHGAKVSHHEQPATLESPAGDGALLTGLRVLDVTQAITGPFCTKLLADYGAEVIKVERPHVGDPSRHMGPFPQDIPHPEKSGTFLHLNTNKRGVTLNLKSSLGARVLLELARWADVVVESYRPGTMDRFGLGYQRLREVRPHLVMVSISSFGQTGPYRDYNATELVAQAMGGPIMHGHGLPDREPLKYAETAGQYFAGINSALATTAAAFQAKLWGIGQHVDVSIMESLQNSSEAKALQSAFTGQPYTREYTVGRHTYLMGAYPCKDGFIGVQGSGRGETWWPRVYEMMGMPELVNDPRFSTPQARAANLEEFHVLWYSWLAEHTRQEVFEAAMKARFPVAPVYTTEDMLKDPHFQARGYFVGVEHPVAGTVVQPGAPFKVDAAPWRVRRPAPCLGQHNEEVYCGLLGFSHPDLALLRERGVI